MSQKTRKLTAVYKALHVDRLYVSRKKEEEDLPSIRDSVDALIHRLEDYIEKRGGWLITATRKKYWNLRTKRTAIARNKNGKKNKYMDVLND